MKRQIEFVDITASKQLTKQIDQELKKIENRYTWVTQANVFLKRSQEQEHECICEIEIHLPGNPLFVKEDGDKFSFAITKAFGVMLRQLNKRKEKSFSH